MKAADYWSMGYFCALAKMLQEEGEVTPAIRGLFKAGGDWAYADEGDIEVFKQHGLIS